MATFGLILGAVDLVDELIDRSVEKLIIKINFFFDTVFVVTKRFAETTFDFRLWSIEKKIESIG